MGFGECLKQLLSILGISMSQLSKAINVDNSLVNRWVHGKRIPPYNTSYIERISEYLSKNITNSFQIQQLNKLYMDISGYCSLENSMKEKIEKILSEAQGYSIECKKKEQNTKFNDKNSLTSKNSDELQYNHSAHIGLSNEDKILIGKINVLSATIHLLKAAAKKNCKNNNTIYISLINDIDMISLQHANLVYLREIINKAIQSGWNVTLLIKINSNTSRIIKLINIAKPLIKTGKFNPYYMKRYDIFTTGKEILCVPEIGVLYCFSSEPFSGIDSAFYLKTKVAIDIIKNYFNILLTTCAQPLFNYYLDKDCSKFNNYFVKNEESIGNRILYKPCFSALIIPKNLYIKILKNIGLTYDEILASQEYYEKRLNAFTINVQNYEYKDIYCYESVMQLIKHQQFIFYYHMGVKLIDLEVKDVVEILRNIINLLRKFENYYIAFTNSTSTNDEFYCMIKERQAVLLEIYEPLKSIQSMRVSIDEPMVVKAFEEYFTEKWEHIAPINRDKNEVINWIQKQIKLLETKISNEVV